MFYFFYFVIMASLKLYDAITDPHYKVGNLLLFMAFSILAVLKWDQQWRKAGELDQSTKGH